MSTIKETVEALRSFSGAIKNLSFKKEVIDKIDEIADTR